MRFTYRHHTALWISLVAIVFSGSMLFAEASHSETVAPVFSNIRATDVTQTDAIIRWTTDIPSDSQIEYGFTSAFGTKTAINGAFVMDHAFVLASGTLDYSRTYHYRVLSRDSYGHLGTSSEQTFTTPVQTPGAFQYGAYAWTPLYTSTGTSKGTWNAAIDGLRQDSIAPDQRYKLIATTMDDTGDYDTVITFALRTGGELGVCGRMDKWGNGYCFSTSPTGETRLSSFVGNAKEPTLLATGIPLSITPNTDYTIRLRFQNYTLFAKIYPASLEVEPSAWNVIYTDAASTFPRGKLGFYTYMTQPSLKYINVSPILYTPSDSTPPTISSVAAPSVGTDTARITWVTDEYANAQVEYGTSTAYGSQTVLDPTWNLFHSATLGALLPDTVYYYRVKSKDTLGNAGVGSGVQFATHAAPVVAQPVTTTTSTAPINAIPPYQLSPSQP